MVLRIANAKQVFFYCYTYTKIIDYVFVNTNAHNFISILTFSSSLCHKFIFTLYFKALLNNMENQTNLPPQENLNPFETNPVYNKPPSFTERNKLLLKGIIVALLILFLMIPQFFIQNLVSERKSRLTEVEAQIAKTWSGEQTIAGPMIAVPYKKLVTSENGSNVKSYYVKKYAYLMPEKLDIACGIKPESKRIGIFNVSVYDGNIAAKGNFKNTNWIKLGIANEDVYWNEVRVLIGISDFNGLNKEISLNWNGKETIGEVGFEDVSVLSKAIQFPIVFSAADIMNDYAFSFGIQLRGSSSIHFIPVGKHTAVVLDTKWKTPRFSGNYPATHNEDYDVKPLHTSWSVLSMNRNFPQQWKEGEVHLDYDKFGLELIQPIDTYAKTMRSVKYALLLISLTFIIYFFIELMQKKSAHPIQYVLVGLALTIFYLLLLSIAEYAGFTTAYMLSACATIGLISFYTSSVFAQRKITYAIASFLSLIYLFIYLLIQLEDGALLLGSIGLFVILSAIMYVSKKINWYPLPQEA
jgi:inner membrane protein